MSILTSIEQGLCYPPDTSSGQIDQRLRNGQRYARWQQTLQRQGSGAYPRPSGWGIFCGAVSITAQAIGLLILAAILFFWVVVADALVNTPAPESREFDRPIDGTSYARMQHEWHAGNQ